MTTAPDAAPAADPTTRAWRDGRAWFEEHYHDAARQVVDFFGADGISLEGKDVADVGCGDGIIDLGIVHAARPRRLVGFDILETDTRRLRDLAAAFGVADALPAELEFRRCSATRLPADDASFDFVVSWSAFEHVLDPVGVLREVRRVLRPDGLLMIQLWPFFLSQHGSHLWDFDSAGFVQLLDRRFQEVEEQVRSDLAADPDWAEARLEEARTLNRITLDDLHRALLAGGFYVSKVELLHNALHVPRELACHSLSDLLIGGVKLVAGPLR